MNGKYAQTMDKWLTYMLCQHSVWTCHHKLIQASDGADSVSI